MAHILIIEDILDNAELIQRVVEAKGHTTELAADGESALRLAAEHKPDLIVLDLGLPDIDGPTVLTQLRRIPDRAEIPVVAVTAWPEETARKVVAAYGCAGFLAKPIRIDDLVALLALHLKA